MPSPLKNNLSLTCDNISFSYEKNIFLFKDISFTLTSGEVLFLMGPNGGGKSTLLKLIVGLLPLSHGKIVLGTHHNTSIFKHTSYLSQIQPYSEELKLPLTVLDYLSLFTANSISTKELEARAHDYACKFKIDSKLNDLFENLSGGEKQKVKICKTLLENRPIIALDEPTTGLDFEAQDELLVLLKDEAKKNNKMIILVDHHLGKLIPFADKILCVNKHNHWHDHKENLTPSILQGVYGCEFEHTIIHEHTNCDHVSHPHIHNHKKKNDL